MNFTIEKDIQFRGSVRQNYLNKSIKALYSQSADIKTQKMIESIEFEVPEKSAYSKYPNPASRYAVVGVYVSKMKMIG